MRYERSLYGYEGGEHVVSKSYLDAQLRNFSAEMIIDEEGMKLNRISDLNTKTLLAISNEGYVVVNMLVAEQYQKVISTFCREVLGKNMLIVYRRGGLRLFIYPEGTGWKDDTTRRYSWKATDSPLKVAVLDLRLQPVSGLKPMAPLRKRNPITGEYERKTNSQW
jgi:hypothetical protein